MAEFVQKVMEDMLPELEEMERVELFNTKETRQILKKCKAFEYRLQRREKVKDDYMQYIQYEIDLLALVNLRAKEVGYTLKKSDVETAVTKRIHTLFACAESRFGDDIKVWLSHIDFSKSQKDRCNCGQTYTKMLQLHTRKPNLWIAAAQWEFEENQKVEFARNLFHKGLRYNDDSQILWLEYFKLELIHTEKVRTILNDLTFETAKRRKVDFSEVEIDGTVAIIVFNNPMTKFSDDLSFCLSFINICQEFPVVSVVLEYIYTYIEENFGTNEKTRDGLCQKDYMKERVKLRLEGTDITTIDIAESLMKQEEKCYVSYDSCVAEYDSDLMWTLYAEFCEKCLQDKSNTTTKLQNQRQAQFIHVMKQSHLKNHKLTIKLYMTWLNLLTYNEMVKLAIHTVVFKHYPDDIELNNIYFEKIILSDLEKQEICKVLRNHLDQVKPHLATEDYADLLRLLIHFCKTHQPELCVSFLEEGIGLKGQSGAEYKALYLSWINATDKHKNVRRLYKRLVVLRPLCSEFFQKAVEIEENRNPMDVKVIRNIYEDALRELAKHDTDLWMSYLKFERSHGSLKNMTKLHWRAMKEIDGEHIERFITQYTLLQADKL